MISRTLQKDVIRYLSLFPVVAILGARQVGKTTLARYVQKNFFQQARYFDLELPSDLHKLEEPEIFLAQFSDHLIILDEIQRKPELFPLLRALVDKDRRPGRFLILGSASPDLIKQSSETLAGRIAYLELKPFSLQEVNPENWQNLWLRGGFPESYLAVSDETSLSWREFFIQTYLERDIPQLGFKVSAVQLRRFMTMLAHNHCQLWNASQMANSLGVSPPTARYYLDMLEDTYLVRQLKPFYINIGKRLIKSPKIMIRDAGIINYLLNITSFEDLHSHPLLGNIWEGFVIEEILKHLPSTYAPYFYRTRAGAEIDLILTRAEKVVAAIEIKYSLRPKLQKGFWNAVKDLQPEIKIVVYPGEESYPAKDNILMLAISDLSNWMQEFSRHKGVGL